MTPRLLAALDAGATLVTPNRRLARHLHRAFDAVQHRLGLNAWPTPSILPYPQWLAALWDDAAARDAVGESDSLLSASQSALAWRQIVESDEDRVPLLDASGAASLASEAWSLVHEWGAGGESWRAWGSEDAPDDPAVFARWAESYSARLRAARAVDLALLPDALLRAAGRFPCAPAVLAGFVELNAQQQRLVAALGNAGVHIRLEDTLPEIEATATRVGAETPGDELGAALAWARARVLERPQARIGIVVEDLLARRDEVLARATEILSPSAALPGDSRPSFEISLGAPLAAVPLVASALDLIELFDGSLPAGAAAALLRSPYIAEAEIDWTKRARVEREWLGLGVAQVRLAETIAGLGRWSPALAERWRSAHAALHSGRRSTPREWSDAWRAWLAAAGWPGSRPLASAEFQARERWEELLTEFASLVVVAPRLSAARAVATLRAFAVERRFQPEGRAASIEILGLLEGDGLSFDALWVAGLSADRWPAAPRPNPLLPLPWQRERNVARATAQREREFAESLTARFARAAPDVVFSSAAHADDQPLSPSALILRYPEREKPPVAASWTATIAASARLESIDDDRAPALPGDQPVRGGAYVVAAQSDCPFQAVVRHRLRAEPWPRPCSGLTPRERGSLVHEALARLWDELRDSRTLAALDDRALGGRIATAVDSALSKLDPRRWQALPALLRECEAARIAELARAWLAVERERSPFRVEAVEFRTTLRLAGVELKLKIDRIDALDGGAAILDYKTGEVDEPRKWFDERPRSAQLGLYTLALREASPSRRVRAVGYAALRAEGVSAKGIAEENAWPRFDSPAKRAPGGTWESLEAWWRAKLEALAREIAWGHAAVAPRAYPSPCRNCGLQAVCRIESVRASESDEAGNE